MTIYVPDRKIALASSFEGVVNDGVRECALTSVNAYERMHPGATYGRIVEPQDYSSVQDSTLIRAFLLLRPLVEVAEDYHTVIDVILRNPRLAHRLVQNPEDERLYDVFGPAFEKRKAETAEERRVFGAKGGEFYQERKRMQDADYEAWLGVQAPYPESIAQLRELVKTQRARRGVIQSGFVPYFGTSKDEASTWELCRYYSRTGRLEPRDVGDMVAECVIHPSRIIGKETTTDKLKQMVIIGGLEDVPKNQVWRLNDRYDPAQQEQLHADGFNHQFFVTGGYAFPHEVRRAREDRNLVVVNRQNMAEELAAFAKGHGF